jgi:1,4-alpha-glucan branching enzyme
MASVQIPAPAAKSVEMRFASVEERDSFDPRAWRRAPLARVAARPGWWALDPETLGLRDGDYEYEFVLDGLDEAPVADPFADEITRFGGYRGLFRLRGGRRAQPFRWDDELPPGVRLPNNNEIVIYEMPLRWMSTGGEDFRQFGLGTFEEVIFRHLDRLADLGVNAIELLPVQDSADTLNWGYGSRFFFAPDFDMGGPLDLKLFVKRCHQKGIRVILDIVMNHARACPLEALAYDRYFLKKDRKEEEPEREDYGGRRFRYRDPAPDGTFPAREFHFAMAEFWIETYRIDGFRIDEFKGINHWEFIQQFRDRAWAAFRRRFPDRPFIVIAEDSWRRAVVTQDAGTNPNRRKVADAIWNFAFRDEARRLVRDEIRTELGKPSRRERIRSMVSGGALWDDLSREFKGGFGDLAQAVNYLTSHDVEKENEARLMNFLLGPMLRDRGLGSGSVESVRRVVDEDGSEKVQDARRQALERVRSAFVLLMTAPGIPMFLAGEEFGDVHDLDHTNWQLKMSDPVDWSRADRPGHRVLRDAVRDLIRLRTSHAALHRNELDFFYFHPAIDQDGGTRVFAYCRTGGFPLGAAGQVVVFANGGPEDFHGFRFPWAWGSAGPPVERGGPAEGAPLAVRTPESAATISLAPFQIRTFVV